MLKCIPWHRVWHSCPTRHTIISCWFPGPLPEVLAPATPAETYLWIAGTHTLEPSLWNYAAFVRERLSHWVGEGANNGAYEEDRVEDVAEGRRSNVPDVVSQRLAGNYDHE